MREQAALLKREIETKLAHRIPAALSSIPMQAPRLLPMGDARLDGMLGGGLPLGSVCELTGPEGSGRSSLALSLLAEASSESVCAYIDASDTLSPECAAAAGLCLHNLLWVRCGNVIPAQPLKQTPARAAVADARPGVPEDQAPRQIHSGCGSSHPRGETKGLAPALEQMLLDKEERRRRKQEGTPGHPNQPLGLHTASKEQVDWERFNLRRVDEADPLRQSDQEAAKTARIRAAQSMRPVPAPAYGEIPSRDAHSGPSARKRPDTAFDRLDRALRATDQILQSGGFRVVVLDLGSMDPRSALRIPSATWFRFRRAAQESDAILLLISREPCAGTSAACVLECSAGKPPSVQGVLHGAIRTAEVARQRVGPVSDHKRLHDKGLGRKAPGRATDWDACPVWMRAVGG